MPIPASELDGRVGSRILPEWIDVVDDPTQKEWRGRTLMGAFTLDLEGQLPMPVQVIEKGVLKDILRTRQPVRGFEGSNGHARLGGGFGAKTAFLSNLFVQARQTSTAAELKKRLIESATARNKPYAILIRKMDYPSSASYGELQRLAGSMAQSGGTTRPVSPPILVYRIYADGKEELVQGLRLRNFSVRSFRDIVAASDESVAYDFIGNLAPFSLMGAGGYVAPATVIAPAVLFEELELEHPQEERPTLPVVPPPPLIAGN